MNAPQEYQNAIQRLMNAGFNVLGMDHSGNLIIEDPSCLLRVFETFLNYAWTIIVFITGILLFGWAISKLRGGTTKVEKNLVNLTIIFGVLSATKPIINLVYGSDLFAQGCARLSIPIQEVTKKYQDKLSEKDLYENIDIQIDDYTTLTPDDINWDDYPPVEFPDFIEDDEIIQREWVKTQQSE